MKKVEIRGDGFVIKVEEGPEDPIDAEAVIFIPDDKVPTIQDVEGSVERCVITIKGCETPKVQTWHTKNNQVLLGDEIELSGVDISFFNVVLQGMILTGLESFPEAFRNLPTKFT